MQNVTEEEREVLIMQHSELCKSGSTRSIRIYHWSLMKNLIDGRSAETVRRLEMAKGLRAA